MKFCFVAVPLVNDGISDVRKEHAVWKTKRLGSEL